MVHKPPFLSPAEGRLGGSSSSPTKDVFGVPQTGEARELQDEAKSKEKEMVKSRELERDVRRLKRKVQQWKVEEDHHR